MTSNKSLRLCSQSFILFFPWHLLFWQIFISSLYFLSSQSYFNVCLSWWIIIWHPLAREIYLMYPNFHYVRLHLTPVVWCNADYHRGRLWNMETWSDALCFVFIFSLLWVVASSRTEITLTLTPTLRREAQHIVLRTDNSFHFFGRIFFFFGLSQYRNIKPQTQGRVRGCRGSLTTDIVMQGLSTGKHSRGLLNINKAA